MQDRFKPESKRKVPSHDVRWVISGHFAVQLGMSALCQKRTSCARVTCAEPSPLFEMRSDLVPSNYRTRDIVFGLTL